MKIKNAFSTTEVLLALTIVAIFVMAGFQLYELSNQSNLLSRSRAIASNIAYDHLRQVANQATIDDCPISEVVHNDHYADQCTEVIPVTDPPTPPIVHIVKQTPFDNEKFLPGLSINSLITSPYGDCTQRILKVEITVNYKVKGTNQTERQILYVQK